MRGILNVTLIWAVTVIAATASSGNLDLQRKINNEFLNKPFDTKILLGSYLTLPGAGNQDACYKLVDTELSPAGAIQYQVRKGCYTSNGRWYGDIMSSNYYVDAEKLTGRLIIGTQVVVAKIEYKDNRVEFDLGTVGSSGLDGRAKIKFMLGQGYQSRSYDDLLQIFAKAIRIESYERVLALQQEYEDLKQHLALADDRFRSAQGSAVEKLNNANQLRDTLLKLDQNRSAYTATGHQDTSGKQYAERAEALAPKIATLEKSAQAERVQIALGKLNAQAPELLRLQSQLRQKPPSTMSEWKTRSEMLDKYAGALAEREELYGTLQDNGHPAAAADLADLQNKKDEATHMRQALEHDHGQVQLAEIDSEYRQMDRKRAQLEDNYVRVFGTAQEASAKQAVVSQLEKMKTNRIAAQQQGESAAAGQVKRLEAEITKFSRK